MLKKVSFALGTGFNASEFQNTVSIDLNHSIKIQAFLSYLDRHKIEKKWFAIKYGANSGRYESQIQFLKVRNKREKKCCEMN